MDGVFQRVIRDTRKIGEFTVDEENYSFNTLDGKLRIKWNEKQLSGRNSHVWEFFYFTFIAFRFFKIVIKDYFLVLSFWFSYYFQFPYHFSKQKNQKKNKISPKINTEIAKAGGIIDGFNDKNNEDNVTNDYEDEEEDERDCNETDFLCKDKIQCVLTEKRCNGAKDCNDGSDEDGCENEHNHEITKDVNSFDDKKGD